MSIPASVYVDTYEVTIRTGDKSCVGATLQIIQTEARALLSHIHVRQQLQEIIEFHERVNSDFVKLSGIFTT